MHDGRESPKKLNRTNDITEFHLAFEIGGKGCAKKSGKECAKKKQLRSRKAFLCSKKGCEEGNKREKRSKNKINNRNNQSNVHGKFGLGEEKKKTNDHQRYKETPSTGQSKVFILKKQ